MPEEPGISPPMPPSASGTWPPPPTAPGGLPPQGPTVSYQSPRAFALTASILIGIIVLVDLVSIAANASSGGTLLAGIAALIRFLLLILAGVFFCLWTYRVHQNLLAFGAWGLKATPGWAVGYLFVPILSLFRPYLNYAEAWQVSDPEVDARQKGFWETRPTTPLLPFWWCVWILNNILGNISGRLAMQGGSAAAAKGIDFLSDAADILAGLLAIAFMNAMTARQESKAALLLKQPGG